MKRIAGALIALLMFVLLVGCDPHRPQNNTPQDWAVWILILDHEANQWSCLNTLWQLESGWNIHATNPYSGAYGIPQALPGSKMGAVAPDWQTNGLTQVAWGIYYVNVRYGGPCAALNHEYAFGWY